MEHTNPVIVLGLYFPGIDIIKDFKRRKIQCIGIDCFKTAPGLFLRNAKTYLCPDPEILENEWIAFLIGFKRSDGVKPVLMITSDKFILPVLNNATFLSEYFYFNTSENTSTERLMNKKSLIVAALKSNIDIANTVFYRNPGLFEAEIEKIKYPSLIRPGHGEKWWSDPLKSIVNGNKLIKVDNEENLNEWLEKITPFDQDLIIQEIIPGPDSNLYYLVVYMDKNQKCLGYFCGQKLRITPIHFGSASYMKTVDPSPLINEAVRLLSDNKYWGPAGVEFKKDSTSGKFKLIEINTRFGLWDVMGSKLGVDLFYQAYLDLIGINPVALHPSRKVYKWISISRDLNTFLEYRKEKLLSIKDWLISYTGKVYFADIYIYEPKLMYNLYLKKLFKKVLNKLNIF